MPWHLKFLIGDILLLASVCPKTEYTPAVDIWSVGCIFAELLTGEPLFPGKNVADELDLFTDLLGTPPAESVARIKNEKARRYLNSMKKKKPIPFSQKFPKVDTLALRLLERMLAFDPKDRPTAEEALADPYFDGLENVENEPSRKPISKLEFEFERRKLTQDEVRELIYREILEYHPQMLQEYLQGKDLMHFMYPSGVDWCKQQFACLEEDCGKHERRNPQERRYTSLPRERICSPIDEDTDETDSRKRHSASATRSAVLKSPRLPGVGEQQSVTKDASTTQNDSGKPKKGSCRLVKSHSINASRCVGIIAKGHEVHTDLKKVTAQCA